MAEGRIIDLGFAELPDEPEWPRRIAAARLRPIGLAALVLICVAALSGAVRPQAALTHLGVITWPASALPDGQPPTIAAGLAMAQVDGEVLAYHPDGRLAWRSRPIAKPLDNLAAYSFYPFEDSILLVLVTLSIGSGLERPRAVVSVALDPATGKERWRVDGVPARVGDLFIVSSSWDGSAGRAVYRRLPDGLLWTVPQARTAVFEAATDTLMTLTDEGLFTEYELSTGKPRRTSHLDLPHLDPAPDDLIMEIHRDRLFLRARRYSGPDPVTLTQTYERTSLRPAPPSPMDRYQWVYECGPVLCASTYDRTYILDKDSLAELWRTEVGEFSAVWTEDGMMIEWPSVRLLDERTGQVRLDAYGWLPARSRYWPPPDRMPSLMIQPIGERTYVGRLTPRAVQVIGVIPQRLLECQADEGLLACRMDNEHTTMWRLNALR